MQKAFGIVEEIWEAQLADINAAKKSIRFEQYLLSCLLEGEIGKQFVDALTEKSRAGIEVKCIFDAVGSFDLLQNEQMNAVLESAGVTILYYKTHSGLAKRLSPFRYILRDHRKVLVIDEEIAWIGGVVVTEVLRESNDLMVRYKDGVTPKICAEEFDVQFKRLEQGVVPVSPLWRIDEDSILIGNAPGLGNRFCYERLCHLIMLATDHVTMVTPYFVPPPKLRNIILRQLASGVKMSLLVPRTSDNYLADSARESVLGMYIQHGLSVKYLEQMNHAKIVLSDRQLVSYGSTNLDSLSLIFNHELNIETKNKELIEEIINIIDLWQEGCPAIGVQDCEHHRHSFLRRILGRLTRYVV